MEDRIKKAIEALERNRIQASYFETKRDALEAIIHEIKDTDRVGIGGSMTIKDLGIPEVLRDRGNEIFYHWFETTPEGMNTARKNAQHADVYLTSTNAITEDGKLVNMDGTGNRVATMIYGPTKVFVICGMNKLVENMEAGIARIEGNAWKNAVRLGLKTPCVEKKKCMHCNHPQKMCNALTIINGKTATSLKVFLIGEELGY